MFNWKKKIDDHEEAEKAVRERAEAEIREWLLAEQRKQYQDKLLELSLFKCHVCGFSSQKPKMEVHYSGSIDGSDDTPKPNWSNPADLWQCKKCNKWTCADHLHKGICQTCAEKM